MGAGPDTELGVGASEPRGPAGVEMEDEEVEESWRSGVGPIGAGLGPGGISAFGFETEMKEEGAVKESKKSEAGLACPLSVKNLLRLGLGWQMRGVVILLGVTASVHPPPLPMLKLGDLMRVGWKPSGTRDFGWVPWLNMVHTGTGSFFGLVRLASGGACCSL